MSYSLLARYPVGAIVADRRGYIKIKATAKPGQKKWKPESHLVAELRNLKRPDPKDVGKEIKKDERVFHIGINKSDNRPQNLVVIKIRLTKYALAPTAVALYIPKGQASILDCLKVRGL